MVNCQILKRHMQVAVYLLGGLTCLAFPKNALANSSSDLAIQQSHFAHNPSMANLQAQNSTEQMILPGETLFPLACGRFEGEIDGSDPMLTESDDTSTPGFRFEDVWPTISNELATRFQSDDMETLLGLIFLVSVRSNDFPPTTVIRYQRRPSDVPTRLVASDGRIVSKIGTTLYPSLETRTSGTLFSDGSTSVGQVYSSYYVHGEDEKPNLEIRIGTLADEAVGEYSVQYAVAVADESLSPEMVNSEITQLSPQMVASHLDELCE